MQGKTWWQSKTFWVNVMALLAALIPQLQTFLVDTFGADGAVAVCGAALTVVNLFLRALTNQPIRTR